jgi:hypothetical protein
MTELLVLWAIISAFVVYNAFKVFSSTLRIFSPPLIVSLLTWGVLVKSYFDFDEGTKRAFMDPDYYVFTLVYTVLCLLAYQIGFEYFQKRPFIKTPKSDALVEKMPTYVLTAYVIFVGGIGLFAQIEVASYAGGLTAYYSAVHGSGVDYTQLSAYFYSLPQFMWPAMIVGYVAYIRSDRSNKLLLIVTLIITVLLCAHTYLFGNRNGIIRLTVFLGSAYMFMYRPSFIRAVPLFVLLGFATVSTLTIAYLRDSTRLGADMSLMEAIDDYLQKSSDRGGYLTVRDEAAGHEFFFNIAVVESAWRNTTYDYGAPYIYPIINFIPRAIWLDKPTETEFGVAYFQLVEQTVGWPPGDGAAPSQLGLTFLSFSWAGCLLWAAMGAASGRVYRAAELNPSVMNLGFLGACLIANVFWGTQGWNSVFINWMFTIIPFYGLRIFAILNSKSLKGRQFDGQTSLATSARNYYYNRR